MKRSKACANIITFTDQKMQMYQGDFCQERDTRILICSWNIDANKPEKLTASDDKLVRDWLRGMQDPDIIVVGIQEIVDLESKKQTARKCILFCSLVMILIPIG